MKQASILQSAARLVKPGGRLVYATCSFLIEENEMIVDAFLAKHPQFKLVDVNKIFERLKIPIKDQGAYFTLSPLKHATDGFFAAVMERAK